MRNWIKVLLIILLCIFLIGCGARASPDLEVQSEPPEALLEQRVVTLEQTVEELQTAIDEYEVRLDALEQFTLEPPHWPREPIPTLRDKVEAGE